MPITQAQRAALRPGDLLTLDHAGPYYGLTEDLVPGQPVCFLRPFGRHSVAFYLPHKAFWDTKPHSRRTGRHDILAETANPNNPLHTEVWAAYPTWAAEEVSLFDPPLTGQDALLHRQLL